MKFNVDQILDLPEIKVLNFQGSTVSFMEPNTKSLLLNSFKSLYNKAFIVFNGLFNNNVGGSTIK